MGIVADRVGVFFRPAVQFLRRREELSSDRVARIGGIDQCRHFRGQCRGVAFGDRVERRAVAFGHESGIDEIRDAAWACYAGTCSWPGVAHAGSDAGVHWTSAMRGAPSSSITRRSKPSAQPAASGMCGSAARKSSSIG